MHTSQIIEAFKKSKLPTGKIILLKSEPEIYCFYLNNRSELDDFAKGDKVIYVGISVDLNGRELKQHLTDGETGWSSFRRSVGAIMKKKLHLDAVRRDLPHVQKLRPDKYKFDTIGERNLTNWIKKNTQFGYWISSDKMITKTELKCIEEQLIKELKPILDLDRRTKHLNPFAKQLDSLRKICREEVKSKI